MSETLFILTIVFVAYVVYVAVDEHKATSKSASPKVKPEAPEVVAEQQVPEVVTKNIKSTIIKVATIKKSTPTATVENTVKKGLRDPKTGEVSSTYSNYRFTKRWIKEALVTEGLLDKVYKNNELDAAIEATIKDAIVKLEAMDKYKS
jgi:hypothetical protein